jgi:hypothetical protein
LRRKISAGSQSNDSGGLTNARGYDPQKQALHNARIIGVLFRFVCCMPDAIARIPQ